MASKLLKQFTWAYVVETDHDDGINVDRTNYNAYTWDVNKLKWIRRIDGSRSSRVKDGLEKTIAYAKMRNDEIQAIFDNNKNAPVLPESLK